jgi:hypothetical protein
MGLALKWEWLNGSGIQNEQAIRIFRLFELKGSLILHAPREWLLDNLNSCKNHMFILSHTLLSTVTW